MKIKSSIMVASALLGITASASFGQTNIPTTNDSVVIGTFKAGPSVPVKGADAETSYLSTRVSIAAKVRQVVDGPEKTNSSGIVTKKDVFKVYAFGNKEILQLSLSTNDIRGYSLAYTNFIENNPFDSGAFVARSSQTNLPSVVTANLLGGLYAETEDIVRKADWSVVTRYNYSGYSSFPADMGPFTNLPVFATYKLTFPKRATFVFGTNKVTNIYGTINVNGAFSGIVGATD